MGFKVEESDCCCREGGGRDLYAKKPWGNMDVNAKGHEGSERKIWKTAEKRNCINWVNWFSVSKL
jgi:hypothetical protein